MNILKKFTNRRSAALAAVVILTAIALTVLTGCPEETPPPPRPYTCENGTAIPGTTTLADTTGCLACNDKFEFQNKAAAGGSGVSCVPITPYVCQNGNPIPTPAPRAGLTGCQSCTGDFELSAPAGGAGVACVTPYVCTNGSRIFDAAPGKNLQGCRTCVSGYALNAPAPAPGVACLTISYTCQNGDPIPGPAPTPGDIGCQTCNRNFVLSGTPPATGVSCLSDMDNDDIPDAADNCPNTPNPAQDITPGDTAGHACNADIDDDNDGLIEIWTPEQLHNMRYNLAGTTYDDEAEDTGAAGDAGITTGAPTAATTDCTTAANNVYLCGYELGQSLDFDLDEDGSTTNPDGTLDTGDDAAPHFVTVDGGWEPIGTSETSAFTAIFEGNGFTISNLSITRNQTHVAPFGIINTGAQIRNVGMLGGSITHTGTGTGAKYSAGLVGVQRSGAVTGSYASGNVTVNTGNHFTGGLIGVLSDGSVTASYASGNVTAAYAAAMGGLIGASTNVNDARINVIASYAAGNVTSNDNDGNERIGGLLGWMQATPGTDTVIAASYATGNVNGGGGNDFIGGLVGQQPGLRGIAGITSLIISSYASGNVDGGAAAGDSAGALVGISPNSSSQILASYGFGEVTNAVSAGVSTRPAGITAPAALTAANTAVCSNPTYTTQTTCTSNSLAITAGAWDSTEMECSAPASNPTAGVDYTTYTTMATCTAPGTKTTADTWITWSNASDNTLNAWVFGTGAPKLRYADYDGPGASTTDYCALFLPTVTCGAAGDELPGQ